MPVEIKELIVRVTVDPNVGGASPQPDANPAREREALVSECVDQVLQILKEKQER